MKKRYTEDQIIGFPREANVRATVKELWRKNGFNQAADHPRKAESGGMDVIGRAAPEGAGDRWHGNFKRTPAATMRKACWYAGAVA